MAQEFLLGMNAKIYQGPAGSELSSLTEMGNVKDVTLTLEAGEADVTTRANQGWRATAPTLRECTAEFEMLWKPVYVPHDTLCRSSTSLLFEKSISERLSRSTLYTTMQSIFPASMSASRRCSAGRSMLPPEKPPSS